MITNEIRLELLKLTAAIVANRTLDLEVTDKLISSVYTTFLRLYQTTEEGSG